MNMTLIREGSWNAVEPKEGQHIDEKTSLRARVAICLSLTSFSLIQDTKDAWKKLKTAFQDDGLTWKIGLLRKLTSIRLESCSSVESYVNDLMSTACELAGIGFKVDDYWLAVLFMMGPAELYEPMIMGLEASRTAITPDAVEVKFLQDVKVQNVLRSGSDDGALMTSSRSRRRNVAGDGSKMEKDDGVVLRLRSFLTPRRYVNRKLLTTP